MQNTTDGSDIEIENLFKVVSCDFISFVNVWASQNFSQGLQHSKG